MEGELHDGEFDLGDVVDDVTMSDDELEKELKQLEEERSGDKPDTIDTSKITANDKGRKNGHSEQKCPEDESENGERRRKSSTRCELYDEVEADSSDYHRDRLNNYGHHRRRSYHQFDLKRLNKSLHISATCEDFIVGREVAYRLCEEKVRLFGHVVRVLGQRTTSDIFAETKEIVNHGGIKTELGDRMRSPGGTFLYLMKSRGYATPEQIKEIFKEDNETKKKTKKRQRDATLNANLTKLSECLVKKEEGEDDEQPRPKKKKKKSKAVETVNDDSSNNTDSQCSRKTKELEKDLPTSIVSRDDAGLISAVSAEETVDERPPVDQVKQEPDDLEDGEIERLPVDQVKQEPDDLEDGEID